MARIGEDTFIGTNDAGINGRTPDTAGTSWVRDLGSLQIQSNRVAIVGGPDNGAARLSDAPSDADYYVEAVLYKHTDIGQDAVGPTARHNSSFNWTSAVYDDVANEVQIVVVYNNGASAEEVGTGSAQTFNVASSHTLRLVVDGNNIAASWDGSQIVTGTSANDQTAALNAGFYINYQTGASPTTGIHIDSWFAENDLPSSGSSVHDEQVEGAEAGDVWTTNVLLAGVVSETWTEGATLAEGFSTFESFDTSDEGVAGGDEWTANVVQAGGVADDAITEGANSGDSWEASVVAHTEWAEGAESGDRFTTDNEGGAGSYKKMHVRVGMGL